MWVCMPRSWRACPSMCMCMCMSMPACACACVHLHRKMPHAACQACCTGRALGTASPPSRSPPPRSPPRPAAGQAAREPARGGERHAAERHLAAAAAVGAAAAAAAAAAATPSVPLLPLPLQPVPRAHAQHRIGQAGGEPGDLDMCGAIPTPTPPSPAATDHLLQPLTPCHPLTPSAPRNRCVDAEAACSSTTVAAPPASLLKMVQACAPRVL